MDVLQILSIGCIVNRKRTVKNKRSGHERLTLDRIVHFLCVEPTHKHTMNYYKQVHTSLCNKFYNSSVLLLGSSLFQMLSII